MTKTINIQGRPVSIDFEFMEINESHGSNWAEWRVEGFGTDGKQYQGTCQADQDEPEHDHDTEVTNIQEI